MLNLITQNISLPDRFSITPESENNRNSLIQDALKITTIATAEDNSKARDVCVELRKFAKDAEAVRVELNKPLLSAQRLLKSIVDDHLSPVEVEISRLERLATAFVVAERDRAAADAQARLELAREASEADFQSLMAEPIQEAARARGQQLKQVLRWEVTDIDALYKSRPDLCRIEPKASAIQASCVPGMPNLPFGLRLWWEDKATFTTR